MHLETSGNDIRKRIQWNAFFQEVEFRSQEYIDSNICFLNCGSNETLDLNKIKWDDIVCLDVKFNFHTDRIKIYDKFFIHIQKFLNSKGPKVFHPQIFTNEDSFEELKKICNCINNLCVTRQDTHLELYLINDDLVHYEYIMEKINFDKFNLKELKNRKIIYTK